MANPYIGESRLEVGNVIYTLVFSVGTIVAIEEKLGRGFPSIISAMTDPEKASFTVLRVMLWAALQDKHPDVTLKAAGDMIIEAGGFLLVWQRVLETFNAAFPAQEAAPSDDAARPREPSRSLGTGSAS